MFGGIYFGQTALAQQPEYIVYAAVPSGLPGTVRTL